MSPVYKHVLMLIDDETGEPVGGATSLSMLEEPKQTDTLNFSGSGRVFDITTPPILLHERAYKGIHVRLYAVTAKERFMLPQEYAVSLAPEQREGIKRQGWRRYVPWWVPL